MHYSVITSLVVLPLPVYSLFAETLIGTFDCIFVSKDFNSIELIVRIFYICIWFTGGSFVDQIKKFKRTNKNLCECEKEYRWFFVIKFAAEPQQGMNKKMQSDNFFTRYVEYEIHGSK